MIAWNQGGLFVVEVVSFEKLDISGGSRWELKLRFRNLTIEPTYFAQCLENVFSGDKNVTLDGEVVTILKNMYLDLEQLKGDLAEEARLLLLELSKHPSWGKLGDPNFAPEH